MARTTLVGFCQRGSPPPCETQTLIQWQKCNGVSGRVFQNYVTHHCDIEHNSRGCLEIQGYLFWLVDFEQSECPTLPIRRIQGVSLKLTLDCPKPNLRSCQWPCRFTQNCFCFSTRKLLALSSNHGSCRDHAGISITKKNLHTQILSHAHLGYGRNWTSCLASIQTFSFGRIGSDPGPPATSHDMQLLRLERQNEGTPKSKVERQAERRFL